MFNKANLFKEFIINGNIFPKEIVIIKKCYISEKNTLI